MIKQLRYLCALLLMAVASVAWGDEVVYYTLDTTGSLQGTNNSYTGNCDISSDGITWNLTGNSKINPWRIGGKSITNADRTVYTKTAMGSAISKLVLTLGTGANVTINSLKLTVASDVDFLNVIDEVSITPTLSADNTFSPTVGAEWAANSYYKFTFNLTISETSNKFVQFSKVTFYKEKAADAKQEAEVTIGSTTLDLNETTEVTTDGPALTLTTSDETVASVSGTTVTGVAVGTATITATWEEDDNFEAGSKNFTVTVTDPNGPGTVNNPYSVAQALAAIDANEGITGVYAKGIVSEIVTAFSSEYGNISYNISADGTTSSDQLQAYRGKSYDGENFTSEDDIQVGDEVVVFGNLKKYNSTYEFDAGNQLVSLKRSTKEEAGLAFETTEFTINLGESFTAPALTNPNNLEVTWESSNTNVATVANDGTVTLGTVAGYTEITASFAGNDNYLPGSASYRLTVVDQNAHGTADQPYTVAEAIEFINTLGTTTSDVVYVKGVISQVDSYNGTYKSITYWISDDGTTATQMQVYSGKGLESADFSSKDDLKVGDEVTVCGNVKLYNGTPEFDKNNYLVAFNRPATPVLPVPTFSPAAGAVDEGTVVTISVADEENVVDYLQFSYDQENWAEYTDETVITITEDTTIYARSVGTDGSYSEVASATYTIKAETPAEDVVIVYEDKTTFLFNTEGNEWGFPVGTDNKEVEERAFTANDVTIKVAGSEGNGFYYNTQGMLMLGKSGAYLTLPAFDFAVGKIEVIGKSGASGSVKQNIFVGENAVSTETTGATGTNTYVIGADYQAAGNVYTLKVTSSHNTQITQIVVYKATGDEKADPQLKFSATSATATLGSDFVAPTLSYVEGFDGTVIYESSDPDVATVDEDGNVTIVAAGVTTITATSEATDNYLAGEASYTLTVQEAPVAGDDKYKLVTDASTLKAGDELIIGSVDKTGLVDAKAMSTTQNKNNRADDGLTVNKDGTVTPSSKIATIVLEGEEDAWLFRTTNGNETTDNTNALGYLYAPGGGNYMRTATLEKAGGKAKATVSIDDAGNATIVFNLAESGDYAEHPRNIIRHNESSNLYSCYADNSTVTGAVQIYRKVTSTETVKGDVNGDGSPTIADVTALVNIILGKVTTENNPDNYNFEAADVNNDGSPTIADVTELVNIILGKKN